MAALESGIITPTSIIEDRGIYTYYVDPQPMCWSLPAGRHHPRAHQRDSGHHGILQLILLRGGTADGHPEAGQYASQFGLGQSTGIEIGDSSGVLASPEWADSHNQEWTDGQTITAAIGQSYNLFTPLQLANYTATLACRR